MRTGQLFKMNKYKTKAQQTAEERTQHLNVVHKHSCSVKNVFYAAYKHSYEYDRMDWLRGMGG